MSTTTLLLLLIGIMYVSLREGRIQVLKGELRAAQNAFHNQSVALAEVKARADQMTNMWNHEVRERQAAERRAEAVEQDKKQA